MIQQTLEQLANRADGPLIKEMFLTPIMHSAVGYTHRSPGIRIGENTE